MTAFKTFLKWLFKSIFWILTIALIIIYVSSILWFKLGLSFAPTFFGYTAFNSTISVDTPKIEKGDLIAAREYLYGEKAETHDIIVYEEEDLGVGVSIVEETLLNDEDELVYKVTSSSTGKEAFIHPRDTIGELIVVFDGLGGIYDKLMSPTVILTIIVVWIIVLKIMNIIIAIRNRAKKKSSLHDKKDEAKSPSEVLLNDNVKAEIHSEGVDETSLDGTTNLVNPNVSVTESTKQCENISSEGKDTISCDEDLNKESLNVILDNEEFINKDVECNKNTISLENSGENKDNVNNNSSKKNVQSTKKTNGEKKPNNKKKSKSKKKANKRKKSINKKKKKKKAKSN